MTSTPSELVRSLRLPAYAVIAVLAVIPILEIGVSAWPSRWHEPPWRLAFLSTTAGAIGTTLFALFLLLTIGVLSGGRGTVWLVAVISGLASALSIIGAGTFALDALQMRAQLEAAQASRYTAQSLWALGKICVGAIAFLVLTLSSFKAAKKLRPSKPVTKHARAPVLAGLVNPKPGTGPSNAVPTEPSQSALPR